MGRVIKNVDEDDVTSAALDETLAVEGAQRIPADAVSAPEEDSESDVRPPTEGTVLRKDVARTTDDPVLVDAEKVRTPSQNDGTDSGSTARTSPEDRTDGPDAEPIPSRTDAEWQDYLEEAVEEARAEAYENGQDDGYDVGYEEGYEEAETKMRAQYEEDRHELVEDLRSVDALWDEFIEESETMLVDLALQLAETIVDAPLTESIRQASEEALLEAVSHLSKTPPVTITVHPVDYQRLRESGLTDRLQEKYDDLTLESDPDCNEGDWSVSSPEGVVRRLRSEVVETLRRELRLTHSRSSSDAE